MRTQAEEIGELVEHLVLDHRRLHVGDEEPLAPPGFGLDDTIDRRRGDQPGGHPGGVIGVAFGDREVAGDPGREPVRANPQRGAERGDDTGEIALPAGPGDQGHDEGQRHPDVSCAAHRHRFAPGRAPVVVVAGPTASGKSTLALALALALDGTIINADSIQTYRDLRILSARPGRAEEDAAPHRLYGFRDAAEKGSVASWRGSALAEIAAATGSGRLPIVVGGSGLYLQALQHGLAAIPAIPSSVGEEAVALHRAEGGAAFRARLAALDPDAAARLPAGDTQRLIRAFAVVRATGIPLALWQRRGAERAPYRFATILLSPPRAALYAACDARLAAMVEVGAIEEAAALAGRGLDPMLPAMKALGLRELLRHLAGALDLAAALAAAQAATRRYAKRQMTWFRHHGAAELVLDEKFSESFISRSRHFIRDTLLTPSG
jgi:tRNA dimethylallyltransferase